MPPQKPQTCEFMTQTEVEVEIKKTEFFSDFKHSENLENNLQH